MTEGYTVGDFGEKITVVPSAETLQSRTARFSGVVGNEEVEAAGRNEWTLFVHVKGEPGRFQGGIERVVIQLPETEPGRLWETEGPAGSPTYDSTYEDHERSFQLVWDVRTTGAMGHQWQRSSLLSTSSSQHCSDMGTIPSPELDEPPTQAVLLPRMASNTQRINHQISLF